MSKVLNIIHDEHRSISAILHGMKYLLNEIRAHDRKIDFGVFRAMLYYLDTFSERMHHPKEDRYLFSAMRKHGDEAVSLIDDLEKEHATGEQSLRHLEQALLRYEEGGEKELYGFAHAVEAFSADYWEHMRKEEDQVFPLARKMLSTAEWEEIDRAFAENRDPLAADRDNADFQKLFSRIVTLAPPPIGVGPAAK